MGFMDKVKGMAKKHPDKVDQGIDKGSQTLDERTGGKHSDKIDTGADKARESMDRFSENDRRGGDAA